jgi:hypothetical protein
MEKETTMKLEVGKRYKLADGVLRECTRMIGDDPNAVNDYGYGPFLVGGSAYHQDGTHGSGINPHLNVVRCVDDTPTLWRDMTPEQKGALLLAKHEGKGVEHYGPLTKSWRVGVTCWNPNVAYRIKPEPKVETVVLDLCGKDGWSACEFAHGEHQGKHSITFNLIDGKPDPASIKMEEI